MTSRFVGKLTELVLAGGSWEPFRDGIAIRRLWGEPRAGASVALLRYEPGARGPRHRHGGFEIIYVISGSQSDERGTYTAGSLVVNPEGDEHHVWSDDGCVVLLVWERPVEFG